MPAQPVWFHLLAKIFDTLRTIGSTYPNSRAGEKLFRVCQCRVSWPGRNQPPVARAGNTGSGSSWIVTLGQTARAMSHRWR